MNRQPSFETAPPKQRLTWAISMVHIPEEGITPAQLFLRAGKFAGLPHKTIMALIRVFYVRHGRGKRVMRSSVKRKAL